MSREKPISQLAREQAAHEKRCWVRLTRACNNRCVFCHDSALQDGTRRSVEDLRSEIEIGRQQGAERLVLSGGEPTLHPEFLELIDFGRKLGFRWIQVVSNGRMFAYPGFARRAVTIGLDEVTFSMHGHCAELHDELVGVPGAFVQSLQGMENLQAMGEVVVNIDIVLTARNIPVLPDIVRFFLGRGVREFDLLWLVPFGRAWENRRRLFLDSTMGVSPVREAIALARGAGAVVWTNRLPPAGLEGVEEYIQDPYKFHDEVRGRAPEFEAFWASGEELRCREVERCGQCFVRSFCDSLHRLREEVDIGKLEGIRLDARAGWDVPAPLLASGRRIRLATDDLTSAAVLSGRLPPGSGVLQVELQAAGDCDPSRLRWGAAGPPNRIAASEPAVLDALLPWPGDVEILLTEKSAGWLLENRRKLQERTGRWLLAPMPPAMRSSETHLEIDWVKLADRLRWPNAVWLGVPFCLDGVATHLPLENSWDVSMFGDGGSLRWSAFTEHFIRFLYRSWPARCVDCRRRAECPGWPIQYVRRYGYPKLPVSR